MIKRTFVTMALAGLVVLLGAAPASAQLVYMDPAVLALPTVGANGSVNAMVQGVNPLWGVEFYITFDGNFINAAANTVGTCPAPDFVIYNSFDNTIGSELIRYAVSAVTSGPCDSTTAGVALTMNFSRVAYGTSAINFSLVNPPGISIITDGSVAVCDDSTPACWQNGATDIPVELTNVTVE